MSKEFVALAERSFGDVFTMAGVIEFLAKKGLFELTEIIDHLNNRLKEIEGSPMPKGAKAPTIELIDMLRIAADPTATQ